jgi:hypothetical protein
MDKRSTYVDIPKSESGQERIWACEKKTRSMRAVALVDRVFAVGKHKDQGEPVSSLPPVPHVPPYRRRCQRSHVGDSRAVGTGSKPTANPNRDDNREGKRQASSLTYPSRQAWADGR